MSENKQTKKKETVEPTYKLEQFAQNARKLFSVPPEVVIGALSGVNKAEFTKVEVEQKVQQFMKRKVK
ncbi:hypothetical protein AJ85_05650 [Alkalihalobacillus alcalophilus ATCC 27647 = CGMCC 1.3604]|uniref:YqzN/YkzM domain-containing protein n=1 Tax=Alkalihalobacillus alcalophilus ATCC 27647 = CGMCC 1.3604 TaxID=1218173 RepID=A0A4S4K2Z1_ALKAL|nr:hypothetical protein [Alkalihalobacillus alcalophilus]YP_009276842.1 hypothetical protein BH791_gp36 [Bacillus phage BalMu-1]MED3244885.1 hypothetical protein [Bacillus thuringiensis]AJA42414.1 hypothetical protein BalMu1_B36 [Bacillus phage BalMu-1]AJA42470.1 hypothetical protein BalMu1_A36 [Bacillus phage BalMu-1]MED1561156.1 hypothetical protein [Alkalihalobacillus alcalophilus]THG91307.1 hypothetical protein AJ85_05650 [Alkalihalobacillus alcalophilus ATCC 27647 = CGMCC 1.3604]